MLLYVPCVVIAVTTVLYWFFTRKFGYWKKRNIAGPEPVPFFGNIKESALRRKHAGDLIRDIYNQFKDDKVIGIFRMTTPFLIMKDLDLVKDIMIKNFDAFADRGIEFSKEGLGVNLFHADDDTWRFLRSRFSPIFTTGKLRNMFYLLDQRSDIFVEHLTNDTCEKIEYDIKPMLQKYTISGISACAFGMDIDLNDTKNLKVLADIDRAAVNISPFQEFDFMFPGILKLLNLSLFSEDVKSFFQNLVRNVFSERQGKPSVRKDFMDLILEMMQDGEVHGSNRKDDNGESTLKITESVVAAQAAVFYVAGYETSATTMTFLFYHLAKDPYIQDKLIAEIKEVTQRNGGKITYDSLAEMKYLNQVFDETLRLYPIIETLQRCAKRDYQLPGTDLVVKKGQIVLIPALSIQRDERYYPNPEIFDPERFALENVKDRHSCAYLPFGIGPRNCIGMRFGKIQSLLCIAKLLLKFRVEPSPKTPKTIDIDPYRAVYSPRGGMYLNFVRQQ